MLVSEYVQEQDRYTLENLRCILHCPNTDSVVPLVRKLKEYGILKTVDAEPDNRDFSELSDDDIIVADVNPNEDKYYYVFTFVGVVIVAGRVLKCYPKYLPKQAQPLREMRQLLKVLERYNEKEQIVRLINESGGNRAFNFLAVLMFLLKDYFENGVYSNTREIIESNGSGEILWDRTINETFAILSANRPYYFELQTRKRLNDDYDYFKRLHECVITKASRELKDAGLLDLLELSGVDLSDENIDDFGEKDYILYRIERELNNQFNTRKQTLLKIIYTYIDQSGSLYDPDCLSLFGTNSFNTVWEKICADIMDNKLDNKLGALAPSLPKPLGKDYSPCDKLKNVIEKPLWTATGKRAKDTFIPDLISIWNGQFIIFDAKYYTPELEFGKDPTGQPGIESVTKQYLYQLAYKKFISDHGFSAVKNCFLLPTKDNSVVLKGEVKLNILSDCNLEPIKVRLLPAARAYEFYLSGKKMDISELKLEIMESS